MDKRSLATALVFSPLLALLTVGCSEGPSPGAIPQASAAPPKGPAVPPAPQAKPAADQKVPAAPKEAPKRYTWEELETHLAELREKAKTDPKAAIELRREYDRVATPAYTEAQNYEQHIERLTQWKTAHPDSPTSRVALADAYIAYAWEARGGGVAATVSDDGAHLFIQRIQDAQALLESALKLGAPDAAAYKSLLTVARARGLEREQVNQWYEEGKKLTPNYFALHVEMAEYLRPEWHGEPGEVEAFANQLVTDLPGDEGLAAFGYVVGSINCYDWGRMFRGVYAHESLNGAARVFLELHPDNVKAANYAALFAWAGGDREVGRKARELLIAGGDPMVFASHYRFTCFDRWCKVSKPPTGELSRMWVSMSTPWGLQFDPDPRYVWCANSDGRAPVQRIDTQTGEVDRRFYAPGGVYGIELSKAGDLVAAPIAVQGLNGVVIWPMDASLPPRLIPAEGNCHYAALSPDGKTLAYGNGENVNLTDLNEADGKPRVLPCGGEIEGVEFSNDGKLLAVRVPSRITVFDTQSGKEKPKITLKDPSGTPHLLSAGRPFFFDQLIRLTYLTIVNSYAIVRHDAELRGQSVVHPKCRNLGAAVSPDGKLLVEFRMPNDEPCSLEVWDIERNEVVQQLEGHVCQVFSFAFSPDSKRLATGTSDGEVKIWDLEPARRSLASAGQE